MDLQTCKQQRQNCVIFIRRVFLLKTSFSEKVGMRDRHSSPISRSHKTRTNSIKQTLFVYPDLSYQLVKITEILI